MTKVVTVVTQKGGAGKTTLATNLAGRLAQWLEPDGRRVLLVDLDPQGHAATALGLDTDGRCIGDLLLGKRDFKASLISANRASGGGPRRPNLFVIPASPRLSKARSELEQTILLDVMKRGRRYDGPMMEDVLERALGPYLSLFEYVILDCPPSLGNLDEATYRVSQFVIVPVKMAYLDSHGARLNLDDVTRMQDTGYEAQIAAVVPTMFRPRELVARHQLERFRQLYGERIVAEPIPQSTVVEQAQAGGQRTLFEYDPELRYPVTQAMDSLARRVRQL